MTLPRLLRALAGLLVLWPLSGAAQGAGSAAPVVIQDDTLFHIQARVGSFSAAERAAALEARLERLTRNPFARFDAVRVVSHETATDLVVGDVLLLSVTEADAAAAGLPRRELARGYARAVATALAQQGVAARMRIIGVGVLFAALSTLATLLAIRLINRIFPRVFAVLEAGRNAWIPGLRIQRLELLSSAQLADALLWTARGVRVVLLALLLYISIPVILSFFPWTRDYADRLFGYVLTPFAVVWAGFVSYVPNVFAIGAISLVTWYLLKLIRLCFAGVARGSIRFSGFYPEWAIPTYKIVRALVLVFAFIAVWPYLPGSDSEAFRGVGVFVGLLISLGSAPAVGNMIGGILLTYMRPFQVGDRVRIADTEGDVVEKSLLVTRIRTIKNVDVTIPNSMVLGSHITNYSSSAQGRGLILNTTVTIGYDAPWRHVHELLITAARQTPGVLAEPAPFVLQTSLDDFYVSYQLNAFTDQPNQMAVLYSALHANIQDRFNEAGLEIMSPHYRAARDGNPSTVPSIYLPESYRPPAFRVEPIPSPDNGARAHAAAVQPPAAE